MKIYLRNGKSLTTENVWREIRSRGLLTAVDIDVPGYEWYIFEKLLDSALLQVRAYWLGVNPLNANLLKSIAQLLGSFQADYVYPIKWW